MVVDELLRDVPACLVVDGVPPLAAVNSSTLVAWNVFPRSVRVENLAHSCGVRL
jgi:hypothetical protein